MGGGNTLFSKVKEFVTNRTAVASTVLQSTCSVVGSYLCNPLVEKIIKSYMVKTRRLKVLQNVTLY